MGTDPQLAAIHEWPKGDRPLIGLAKGGQTPDGPPSEQAVNPSAGAP